MFIVPLNDVSPNVASPLTNKLFVILTSLFGIKISPVPLARSSRSLFEFVVAIKLSSIKILPLVISPAISKLPVWTKLPVCVIVPVIVVSCRSVLPLTVNAWPNITSFVGILIVPLPLARSSKSLFERVVSIVLESIWILPFVNEPVIE